jgi:hypothetical protein
VRGQLGEKSKKPSLEARVDAFGFGGEALFVDDPGRWMGFVAGGEFSLSHGKRVQRL